jgi:hypothetical protein
MSSTQATFLDSLTTAVRENPLAAALIGGGALWLLTGTDKLKRAASAAAPLADSGARSFRSATKFASSPPTAPEMDSGSSPVGEAFRDAGSAVADASSDAMGTMKDKFDDGVSYAHETARNVGGSLSGKETFEQAQASLSRLFEQQPLVLGAVGLVVGAAVGGAFGASDLENDWVGEFSDSVKADLNVRADAMSQSVREASDTLKAEMQDVASESADRLREAGSNAMNAAQSAIGR